AKTISRKEENVDDDMNDSFISDSSSSSIKTTRSSFMSASLDNKQDLDSISPGLEGSETKFVDVVQVEEEILEIAHDEITSSSSEGENNDWNDKINVFFQGSPEQQSSNLFKKLRKSDEQDIFNKEDEDDETTDNVDAVTNDNIHNESETSSNDYNEELEDDEKINFDLTNITKELQKEPTVEWKVGSINVTQKFRQYQIEVLKKADKGGLTYEKIYEI
ncbi:4404_t:CDS:2, partial [Acaulospora colombiana]